MRLIPEVRKNAPRSSRVRASTQKKKNLRAGTCVIAPSPLMSPLARFRQQSISSFQVSPGTYSISVGGYYDGSIPVGTLMEHLEMHRHFATLYIHSKLQNKKFKIPRLSHVGGWQLAPQACSPLKFRACGGRSCKRTEALCRDDWHINIRDRCDLLFPTKVTIAPFTIYSPHKEK